MEEPICAFKVYTLTFTFYYCIDPTSAAIVKLWEETWLDLVPSTKTGVKLYLSDLLDIACSALQAQLWRVKALGASSIATITESMGKYKYVY